MSIDHAPNTDPGNDPELLLGLRLSMLHHAGTLLHDARQKDTASVAAARTDGLRLRDIYVGAAPLDTPLEDAVVILLTPTGRPLRRAEPTEYFYVYFPDPQILPETHTGIPPIVWIEKCDGEATSAKYTLTDTSLQDYQGDEVAPAVVAGEAPQSALPYPEARRMYEELKTYRLAPVTHA